MRWIMFTKAKMDVIFNLQNSHLLTFSLPTEGVFQVNGWNRPVANLSVVDFHSKPREMLTPKPPNTFIHQPDWVAPKASDVSAADWLYQQTWKNTIFFHACCHGFSQCRKSLYNTAVYVINMFNYSDFFLICLDIWFFSLSPLSFSFSMILT